ncbi:MAG: signal peptidase I [Gemmatimonadota bacterium]
MTKRAGKWLTEWVKTIVIALIAWFTISTLLLQSFHIISSSMENTLLVGDVLWVNKMLYGAELPLIHVHMPSIREPRRGEIVIFESVETEGLAVVKRIIGMPGDTIAMEKGVLIRDGRRIDEPWVEQGNRPMESDSAARAQIRAWQVGRLVRGDAATYAPDPNNWGPMVVPRDSFFMMGDNRRESYDSRYWGFLPRRNIRGKTLITYFSYDPNTYKPLPVITNIRWGRFFDVPH